MSCTVLGSEVSPASSALFLSPMRLCRIDGCLSLSHGLDLPLPDGICNGFIIDWLWIHCWIRTGFTVDSCEIHNGFIQDLQWILIGFIGDVHRIHMDSYWIHSGFI